MLVMTIVLVEGQKAASRLAQQVVGEILERMAPDACPVHIKKKKKSNVLKFAIAEKTKVESLQPKMTSTSIAKRHKN